MKYSEKKLIFTRFSFLIIVLVVALIFSTFLITTHVSSSTLYKEAARANNLCLEKMSRYVESRVSEIGNSTMLYIKRNISADSIDKIATDETVRRDMARDIQYLIEANPYIDSIYLYTDKEKKVFYYANAAVGVMTYTNFFDTRTCTDFLNRKEYTYLTGIREIRPNYYEESNIAKNSVSVVSLFKRSPFGEQNRDVMVVNINEKHFSTIFSTSNMPSDTMFLITDKNGQSVISYTSEEDQKSLSVNDVHRLYETVMKSEDLSAGFTIKLDDITYFINAHKETSGRIYYLLVPEKSLNVPARRANLFMFIVALLMLGIGCLLAIFISTTISQPIVGIIHRLQDGKELSAEEKKTLVTYPLLEQIEEQIDDIVRESKCQERALTDYFKLYKEKVLLFILEGSKTIDDIPQKNAALLQEYAEHRVIIHQTGKKTKENNDSEVTSHLDETFALLSDFGHVEKAALLQTNRTAFILFATENMQDDTLEEKLKELLTNKPQSLQIQLSAGAAYENSDDIPQSYREALTLLSNAAEDEDLVLTLSEHHPTQDQNMVNLGRIQEKVINSLNTQNLQQAVAGVNEMYDMMFGAGFNLRRIRKQFLFLLYNISLELSSLVSRQKELIFSEPNFDALEYMERPEQLRDWTVDILYKLLSTQKEESPINNRDLINKVISYIADHYQEDISLYIIAEYVFFSPQYLGKLFRESTGVSFTSYLIKVRMEAASNLLLKTKLSVAVIAAKVGYGNVQSFGRIFKSYFGCTPGEYRKKNAVKEL